MFLLMFLLCGITIGYIQGGKTSALSLIRLRHGFLVIGALLIQITLFISNLPLAAKGGLLAHCVSVLLVIAFLYTNRHIRWVELVACGVALNLIAEAAQHGSVLEPSAAHAGTGTAIASALHWASTSLWFLDDVLSVGRRVQFGDAFSIGDLLMGIGLFAISRELVLARATKPQVALDRYQPRHLAKAGNRLLSRQAG